MDCTAEQQNTLLEELAYKAKFKPGNREWTFIFPVHA